MHIYFVRHGQTQTNVEFVPGKIRPKNETLTKIGRDEATDAAKFIKSRPSKPTVIISSPYSRAVETAEIIREELDIPLETDDRLREYSPGIWDGKPSDDFKGLFEQIPEEERHLFRPPGGESWLDEAERINEVIIKASQDGHECIILVSHYDPIKAAVNILTHKPFVDLGSQADYPTGSVTELDNASGKWAFAPKFR